MRTKRTPIVGIYKITSPTGRIYIGQAINIQRRWAAYRGNCKSLKRQPILRRSLLKYGAENHQFDIIEYCSEDELNCSERFWQDEFDVLNGGLNCVLQECGEKRAVYNEEVKRRMSLAKIGKVKNSIKVISKNTLHVFNSIREASKSYGMNKTTLAFMLHGVSPNSTDLIFLTDYENGTDRQKVDTRNNFIDTKTLIIYKTIKEASEAIGIKYGSLKGYLSGVAANHTTIVYLKDYLNNTIPPLPYTRQKMVVDVVTGDIYKSITKASKSINMNNNKLGKMLKNLIENTTNLRYYTNEYTKYK